MRTEQFNELLSYAMLGALASTQLLLRQSLQRDLTPDEAESSQKYLLQNARALQDALNKRPDSFDWPPACPPTGHADG
jgi:hypothetical protein